MIEAHDPNKYRKRIKGFHMAFNIRDKIVKAAEKQKPAISRLPAEEIKKHA